MNNQYPEIVNKAYFDGIIDIGQLSRKEITELNKAVKSGYLMKFKELKIRTGPSLLAVVFPPSPIRSIAICVLARKTASVVLV